jgi:hypothetical protein
MVIPVVGYEPALEGMENNNNGGGSAPNRQEEVTQEWLIQQHTHQQEINAQLMRGIAAIQASLQTPSVSTEPVGPAISTQEELGGVSGARRRPKHSLAHPNKFDGQDRAAYPAFRGFLKVKFRIDAAAIGGETEMVWYGYSYLTGKAAERIFPWLASTEERQEPLRLDDFFRQLDAAFSDPQRAQRALEWINSKKQGSQPFQEFLQEFEQKLLEAGGWEFSDGVRKGYLRSAVSRKIKEKLVAVEEPTRYEDFVNQLRRTSDNLAELDRLGSKRGTWAKPYEEPSGDDSMEWEPTVRVSSGLAPTRNRDTRPPAKWVSRELIDRRRDAQECLRCGNKDHFASRCRYGPAQRPTTRRGNSDPRLQTSAVTNVALPTSGKTIRQRAKIEEVEPASLSEESDSGKD